MHLFKGEHGHRTTGVPSRKLWAALHEVDRAWCEANRVDYLFGLARNERLIEEIRAELAEAAAESAATGKSARRFRDFSWSTLDS